MTEERENPKSKLMRAYRQLFLTPTGTIPEGMQKLILADLAKFCGADRVPTTMGTNGVDPLATMQRIGRLEVWQRIQAHLNLPIRDQILLAHGDETYI